MRLNSFGKMLNLMMKIRVFAFILIGLNIILLQRIIFMSRKKKQ